MLLVVAVLTLAYAGARLWADPVSGEVQGVSQQNRAFIPVLLTIQPGDTVRIQNDDSKLAHHAYLASEALSFVSGELAPGEHVDIAFPVAGTFTVLCGIHPRMRLDVVVTAP